MSEYSYHAPVSNPILGRSTTLPVQCAARQPPRENAVDLPILRFGQLEIDILHRRARIDGRDLHLTSLELSLLCLLASNGGRPLTRDEILDQLWGVDYAAGSNVVDRHVHSLRAKLRDDWRRPRVIATVPGKGYRFVLTAGDGLSDTPPSRAPPQGGAAHSPGSAKSRGRAYGMTKTS